MTKTPEELLNLRFGEKSVGENLRGAINSGRIVENRDGTLEIAGGHKSKGLAWVYVDNGPTLGCGFLMHFLFKEAYAEAAVPMGCSACYKVKIVFNTLRQLVAGWEMGKRVNHHSKWGTDLNNPYSQNVYAGYFYVSGLDAARALYKLVREEVDGNAILGPDIAVTIKRGCSEYEAKLGPSDRYEFKPEMAELEAQLKSRFRRRKTIYEPSMVVAQWIETAYRLGDNTYLDFTGGVRLREKTVAYPP